MQQISKILLHPALLFAIGNAALAVEHAESIGISLNILLVVALLITRIIEVLKSKSYGIPFGVLAIVNFVTACSVIFQLLRSTESISLLSFVAAIAYLSWGIGHLFASKQERQNNLASRIVNNPQVYYGIGDMAAVNASGSINPASFPFMIIGFIKSIFIGKPARTKNKTLKFAYNEVTAARVYGAGYFVGALTSFSHPYFVTAQLFWGLAYLQFKKDTKAP